MSCDLHRCGVLLLMLLWFVSRAQAAEPRSFYEGKTITLLISTSLGLGRDQVSQRGRASEKNRDDGYATTRSHKTHQRDSKGIGIGL